MTVIVAEYLGVRTDLGIPITPVNTLTRTKIPCPFRNAHCDKVARGNKPVCSVWDADTHELWIVCSHRLCATAPKDQPLNEHQKTILHLVAQTIFSPAITRQDVLVKRETPIPVTDDSSYSADYVMWRKNPKVLTLDAPDRPIILEMQGGGETTATGELTRHIDQWEKLPTPSLEILTQPVKKTAPLVTNAWRRQQEQFLVKGNVAMMTGGRMVFCIGSMIERYLMPRLRESIQFRDLRQSNWTLALLTFVEAPDKTNRPECAPHSLALTIDMQRSLFTNYASFVQAITNQGSPCNSLFAEPYITLE